MFKAPRLSVSPSGHSPGHKNSYSSFRPQKPARRSRNTSGPSVKAESTSGDLACSRAVPASLGQGLLRGREAQLRRIQCQARACTGRSLPTTEDAAQEDRSTLSRYLPGRPLHQLAGRPAASPHPEFPVPAQVGSGCAAASARGGGAGPPLPAPEPEPVLSGAEPRSGPERSRLSQAPSSRHGPEHTVFALPSGGHRRV